MKAICIINDPSLVHENLSNFDYGLVKGSEYLIMSIVSTSEGIWYLTDENSKPNFFPSCIFELTDSSLPEGWKIKTINSEDGIFPFNKSAIIGYNEICSKDDHIEKILLRDPDSLRIYFSHKNLYMTSYA